MLDVLPPTIRLVIKVRGMYGMESALAVLNGATTTPLVS